MKKVVLRSAVIGLCMLLLCLLAGCSLKLGKKHSYVNGVCQDCGERLEESEGLNYELSSDGMYYTVTGIGTCKDRDMLIPATYNGKPVTSIVDGAFPGCRTLTSIMIPNSVTSIGGHAFWGCSSLTSITIPDSVTSIGWNAFSGTAYYDNSANWENGVLYIGNHLIQAENSLSGSYSIKAGTKCIADRAFESCSSFADITIPDSVTSIGEQAFSHCAGLTSITVSDQNTTYHSAGNCLIHTASKTLIVGCQASVIPADGSVTGIGDYAFRECGRLVSITIPDGVTSIGKRAFYGCGLTSITIGDSVTSIDMQAFYGCGLKSSASPDRVTITIDDGAGLTSITVSDQNTTYHSAGNCLIHTESKTLITGCQTSVIPADGSVTRMGDYAFYGCSSLKDITIPDSVTSIGDYAFSECTRLTSFTFKGTKAQWNAIVKGSNWNKNTGAYQIICTDGTLSK